MTPEQVKRLTEDSKKYFSNTLSEFIFYRTYSRWKEEESRRETWIEAVDRYLDYMRENLGDRLSDGEYDEIRRAILEQKVMPSMRLMWSAGKAARATHAAAYNCAYIAPTQISDFSEIMYLLMCGVGVGFSVERNTVQQLPGIRPSSAVRSSKQKLVHRIADSKEGWSEALKIGMTHWFQGNDLEFDFSLLRPAGARLHTMGGRSSGSTPLKALFDFTRTKLHAKGGDRLSSLDVYDIICKIGETIVMGGVRRSALISLSDLKDEEMRSAKSGYFYINQPQRSLANNSAVYPTKPTATEFLEEWLALAKSGTGERGIFNRASLPLQLPKRRWEGFQEDWGTCGTNPCGEIILKSKQFCNLTEVIARPLDTEETLLWKTKIATLLGTYQSMLTNFPYLSPEWRKNCEEERLLGVSITGQWDAPCVRDPQILKKLKECAVHVNQEYSQRFGIARSAAVTCVKPSGTVSQLADSSSGMHPRYANYYLRRVRISSTDPLFNLLKDQKVPYLPEVGEVEGEATRYVLEFPVKAPEGAILRKDLNALDQLEHWKRVKVNYTEHNPSVTISVRDEEWIQTANWIYENWELVGGLSFLPFSGAVYPLAPYEEITQEEYEARSKAFPVIDFSQIAAYEKEDQTSGGQTPACAGNSCELDPEEPGA